MLGFEGRQAEGAGGKDIHAVLTHGKEFCIRKEKIFVFAESPSNTEDSVLYSYNRPKSSKEYLGKTPKYQ